MKLVEDNPKITHTK